MVCTGLNVEFEFHYVAILHDVSFSFGAEFAGGFDGLFGAELFEVVEITNIGSDEASLEICMDGAGGFGSGGAFFNGPGTTFFFACSEKRLQA